MQAAADGVGVSIAVCELAESAVRLGRLVSVFDHPVSAGVGFWLVYPEALSEDRRLDNLRGWLRELCPPQNGSRNSGDRSLAAP